VAFKSEAQRRRLTDLAALGKIKPEVVKAMDEASRDAKLPERVTPRPEGRQQFARLAKKARVVK
jgi:hypothetical protein